MIRFIGCLTLFVALCVAGALRCDAQDAPDMMVACSRALCANALRVAAACDEVYFPGPGGQWQRKKTEEAGGPVFEKLTASLK